MRAHFAGDVLSPTGNGGSSIAAEPQNQPKATATASQQPPVDLPARIMAFKEDSKNMAELTEFIDEVLQKAETEAVKQQQVREGDVTTAAQPKEKSRQSFTIPDFKNGKVVNRARGLVVRIFDAICNCANTAAAPAQRMKLRGKRAASATNGGAATTSNAAEIEKLNKKQQSENGKEKKDGDKKKKKEEVELLQQVVDAQQQQQQQQQQSINVVHF